MKNSIMFCSCGRRVQLLKFSKESLGDDYQIVGTDASAIAPALYVCDRSFLVPRIDSPEYMETILQICKENQVKAITTLIDPEIEILAKHRKELLAMGLLPLCPADWTARLCLNKYEMFRHLRSKGVRTVLTYNTLESFRVGLETGEIQFPVFMKPISGSGSVGIGCCRTMAEVEEKWNDGSFTYIIQELMTGGDCDADVYVDCFSHKPVAIFAKKKMASRIGGASKTISYRDTKLFEFVEQVCSVLELYGPCDMDFFIKDGEYLLSEVNPRFGGAYLHAYGAGVDFFKLIKSNIEGLQNESIIGQYDEDIVMMMYDDVVITHKDKLLSQEFSLL